MKKTVVYQGLLVLLLLVFSVPANAVLREENIDKTIIMLKGDLDGFYKYMGDYMRQHQIKRAEYNERMLQTKKETQELSLVLFT